MKLRAELTQAQAASVSYSRRLASQQPDPIHKPLCPEGKTSSLSRDSPIPDTWARTKYLLGTLRITILVFSDVIFQSNVLILRIEMPVFL